MGADSNHGSCYQVVLEQVDVEGNPFSYLKAVEFRGAAAKTVDPAKEPLVHSFSKQSTGRLDVQLHFQGHYDEPPLMIPVDLAQRGGWGW